MSVEEDYNKWAQQYDSNVNPTRDLDHKATVETLNKYSFSTVVELGCGTGKNTAFLISKARTVVGLDFSEEMLAKARQKIHDPRARFRQADITQPWKIQDQAIDLVTANLVLEHLPDLNFVMQEAARKLNDTGLLFICELHPFKQYTGSKARFETENDVKELDCYVHHISEYLGAANEVGFQLVELREWFDDEARTGIPRLISFVFRKPVSY